MAAGQRDAHEEPLAPHVDTRIPPRHPAIWIHLAGAWRRGWIVHWLPRAPGGGWLAWVQYEDPAGKPWPRFGMYSYSPDVIVPRDGDAPPG